MRDKILEEDFLRNNADPDAIRVFTRLMRYHRLQGKVFYNVVAPHELFHAQMIYLKNISVCEGLSQSELADRIGVERASASTALKRMEKAGLILRKPCRDDNRVTRVYLSEKGRELNQETDEAIARFINSCFKLPKAESEQLISSLDALNEKIRVFNNTLREERGV